MPPTSSSSSSSAPLPTLDPAATWTSVTIKELKATLRTEKDGMVTVYRGDIMTVHVPTVPESKRVCWEFATDSYDVLQVRAGVTVATRTVVLAASTGRPGSSKTSDCVYNTRCYY